MDEDRHTMLLTIEYGHVWLRLNCPYDMADESRPCWPYTEDDTPEPAPQTVCTYRTWVEGLSAGELLHGTWTQEVAVDWRWDGGAPEVRLGLPLVVRFGDTGV